MDAKALLVNVACVCILKAVALAGLRMAIKNRKIYILTVYWRSDFWAPIQLKNIARFSEEDVSILAFRDEQTTQVDLKDYGLSGRVLRDGGVKSHAEKLNILAEIASAEASNDDILIFLDADAFPISGYQKFVRDALETYDLCAVRRDENREPQPHPCFCAVTVGVWREIDGDWRRGPIWKDVDGYEATDVGATLYQSLSDHRKNWLPVLRSNKTNLHNAFYGVYGDITYHHGAGSRRLVSRLEIRWLTHNKMYKLIPGRIRVQITKKVSAQISRRNKQLDMKVRDFVGDADEIKKYLL